MAKILIYWREIPIQGTLLNKLSEQHELKVYATKPKVAFELTDYFDFVIHWIEHTSEIEIDNDMDVFLFTGWNNLGILKILIQNRRNFKHKIMMVDNNLRYTVKQFIGFPYFKFWQLFVTDYLIVGRKTYDLLSFYKVPSSKIHLGNYGIPEIFRLKNDEIRPFEFLYVGQYIKRKRVDDLIKIVVELNLGSKVIFAGSGPLNPSKFGITDVGFKQPGDIINYMNNSKALVIISKVEHWGSVVAEAIGCGCFIICSKEVASSNDLVIHGENGFILNTINLTEFRKALELSEEFHKLNERKTLSLFYKNIWGPNMIIKSINRIINANR